MWRGWRVLLRAVVAFTAVLFRVQESRSSVYMAAFWCTTYNNSRSFNNLKSSEWLLLLLHANKTQRVKLEQACIPATCCRAVVDFVNQNVLVAPRRRDDGVTAAPLTGQPPLV